MTDHDHAAARREIADALLKALERRHEVADVMVESDNRAGAIKAIANLLDTTQLGAEAVIGMSLDKFTKEARRKTIAELEDLNKQLTFTIIDRPASTGEGVTLRPFRGKADRDIFSARTENMKAAADGSDAPVASIDEEIRSGLRRIDAEEAAWLVAFVGKDKVGMVFGELAHGEVTVRVWIHPEHRHKGYGTAALRKSRPEMAGLFPAVPMIARDPGVATAN